MSADHGRTMRSGARAPEPEMQYAPNQTQQKTTVEVEAPKKDDHSAHPLWPYFTQWFSMTLLDCESAKQRKSMAAQINSYWGCFRVAGSIVKQLSQQYMAEHNDNTDRTRGTSEETGSSATGAGPTGDSGAK